MFMIILSFVCVCGCVWLCLVVPQQKVRMSLVLDFDSSENNQMNQFSRDCCLVCVLFQMKCQISYFFTQVLALVLGFFLFCFVLSLQVFLICQIERLSLCTQMMLETFAKLTFFFLVIFAIPFNLLVPMLFIVAICSQLPSISFRSPGRVTTMCAIVH